jgi:hypothetical protein
MVELGRGEIHEDVGAEDVRQDTSVTDDVVTGSSRQRANVVTVAVPRDEGATYTTPTTCHDQTLHQDSGPTSS